MSRRLIVIGPVPPPVHGVAVSTRLVLANPYLREHFDVEHLDTSDRRAVATIGRWDVTNVALALTAVLRLGSRVARERGGLVYLPVSQNRSGFLRDALFVLVARLFRWRVAVHLRGGEFQHFVRSSGRPYRRWIRFALSRVDGAGVLGASLKGNFDGLVAPERIAVVPNGTPEPPALADPAESRTVVYLSNLRARKGVLESVEAALQVLASGVRARFVFVGAWEDPDVEHAVRRRAEAAGEAITFLPPVTGEERDALLASAAALLFPPKEPEGHPRVVLEAIAVGLPVVATDQGAVAETVVDGEGGYVLDDADPAVLARCLVELLEHPELRRTMGSNARRRYLEHFTEDESARRLDRWLTSLVERSP